MMRILRKLSGRYKLLSIQVVRTTNNMPCVVVVEKLEHDLVHETLKHQLYDMSQYVNISQTLGTQQNKQQHQTKGTVCSFGCSFPCLHACQLFHESLALSARLSL